MTAKGLDAVQHEFLFGKPQKARKGKQGKGKISPVEARLRKILTVFGYEVARVHFKGDNAIVGIILPR